MKIPYVNHLPKWTTLDSPMGVGLSEVLLHILMQYLNTLIYGSCYSIYDMHMHILFYQWWSVCLQIYTWAKVSHGTQFKA